MFLHKAMMYSCFKAFILSRNWTVSHPIACPGYVRPADQRLNDSRATNCSTLSLQGIECSLPLCPMINDTAASGLNPADSKAKLITDPAAALSRKAGTNLMYQCVNPSKWT